MLTIAAIKALLGIAVGPIAAFFQAREARLTKEAEYKERALERTHELAVGQQEADNAARKEAIISDGKVKQDELTAFGKSYEFANRPMLSPATKLTGWHKTIAVLSDTFQTSLRPGLTVYYQLAQTGLLIYILWLANQLSIPIIDATFAQEIMREIVWSIITLAEMSFGWWFGIRMLSTKGKR